MPYLFAAAAVVSSALAVPNHGLEWRTIGDPGNPATDPAIHHPTSSVPRGAVDYKYRLARTEITYAQQLEFLNAYNPYIQDSDRRPWGQISNIGGTWDLNEGAENRPGQMSTRLWMRYANWLHNDKALSQDAFESGAYDTSMVGEIRDEDGRIIALTDQMTRSPGARFWLPSIDEWTKGGYWDPNRYGEGEGGYWLYPNGTDEPLVSGAPENGGETNAGEALNRPLDVGSYPDTQTPWGLLDYSGGAREAVERINAVSGLVMGTRDGDRTSLDRLGTLGFGSGMSSFQSVRLASAVPAPSAGLPMVFMYALARRRRGV